MVGFSSSSSGGGRFTGPILGLVVFVCVAMIGAAGYLKYQLDRAETALIAPESTLPADQETTEKIRRALGFGGFTGAAQVYAVSHDAAALPEMKAQIKAAHEMFGRLPERTPTEARHDIQAIIAAFDAVMQKAEKSLTDPATVFAAADLAPLYAALPVLDARLAVAAAANRVIAHNQLQIWAMLLTLVSWSSLIIAAACAAGIYLSLRSRNSAPLRALAQSVKNMARGDMRNPVWGMERQDMVGELARTVDLARYHFSQLPDMTLLSEQGPVRIRFEGNTKSLFEAMMQLIGRDSEQMRTLATTLADAVNRQQDSVTQLSSRVEQILHEILKRGQDGNQQVKQALHDTLGSAQALKSAQEHAADQLNRLIPHLQERAKSLAEITAIAGKQVAQTLQSLSTTEHGLRTSAAGSEDAVKKLSTTTDELSSRLFGAVNLMQASGKVLAETTETARSRLNEAIEKLTPEAVAAAPGMSPQIDALIASLESARSKLESLIAEQTKAAEAQVGLLATHSAGLLSQATTTAQTLSAVADRLREREAKFDEAINQVGARLDELAAKITAPEPDQNHLVELAAQVAQLAGKITALERASAAPGDSFASQLLIELKTGFETTVRSLAEMREQMASIVINAQPPAVFTPALPAPADTSALLHTQEQLEQQTQIMTELVTALGLLDAHMREIENSFRGLQRTAG